jgi:hypothetical protein
MKSVVRKDAIFFHVLLRFAVQRVQTFFVRWYLLKKKNNGT